MAIEEYLKSADALAQEVVNAWGLNVHAGNAESLTSEFKIVLDKACRYQDAKRLTDSYRQFSLVSDTDAEAKETAARQTFAEAFKAWKEKQDP